MSGIREVDGRFYARVRYASDKPQLERLLPAIKDRPAAHARAELIERVVRELHGAGFVPQAMRALDELAKAETDKQVDVVVKAARAITKDARRAHLAGEVTIRQWGDEYTSGRLSKKHPDDVRVKDWSDDVSRLSKYVYPHVGDTPVSMFTIAHAKLVMGKLPESLRPASRRHVAQVMNRLLTLAVWPGQLLPHNPLPSRWMPKIPGRKYYSFLFPQEESMFLACAEVPALARLFLGILDREGMRVSELWDSEWWQWNLDLPDDAGAARGGFTLTKNKTKDPRMWALAPDVVLAMRQLRDLTKPRPTAKPFAHLGRYVVAALHDRHRASGGRKKTDGRESLAPAFRRWLKIAGIERGELFESTAETGRMRAHDLRATFVTVSLANGRTETWVRDRTAHKTTTMIDRYRRAARQWEELRLGALAPLVDALGEGWLRDGSLIGPPEARAHGTGISAVPKEGLEPSRGVTPADFESHTVDPGPSAADEPSEEEPPPEACAARIPHTSLTPSAVRRRSASRPSRHRSTRARRGPGGAS